MPLINEEKLLRDAEEFLATEPGNCTMNVAHKLVTNLLRIIKDREEDREALKPLIEAKRHLETIQQEAEDGVEAIDTHLKESGLKECKDENTSRVDAQRRCGRRV